jgi:glycogenin glucosyltransferase
MKSIVRIHTQMYAYVTLVMLGDNYAKGAMVLAQTLRDVNSKYPLWCMVTEDVSAQARLGLSCVFDKIVEVPLISKSSKKLRTVKQEEIYGGWIAHSYTKWNAIDPTIMSGIDKCLFIDADAIVRQNIDELFEFKGPAGVFGTPWAVPFTKGASAIPNFYLDKQRNPPKHEQLITHDQIRRGLAGGFVADASLVLLYPNRQAFQTILRKLNTISDYGHPKCYSGSDEQLLADMMINMTSGPYTQVYNIHQSFSCHIGKESWAAGKPIRVTQYYNSKPWDNIFSREDLQRVLGETQWEDIAKWWVLAEKVIANNPATEEVYFPGVREGAAEMSAASFLADILG